MPIKRHRRVAILALAFLGTALGAPSGYWLGRATLLHTADNSLSNYASDLVHHADEYAVELRTIRDALIRSRYSYCSREEIAAMQGMTFNSLQVKEIGRIHDGKLDCSAFLGRLDPPLTEPPVDMTLDADTHVYLKVPLLIANMAPGTILESGGIAVVLSPNSFDHWSRPHVRYMVLIVNREKAQIGQIAGETLQVDPAWVFQQQEKLVGGELYRSRCSTRSSVCIVTAESTEDALLGSRPLLLEYCGLGGFAGLGLGLAFAQFYLQRTGLAQQLRRAIRKDLISLAYQPIFELPTHRMVGVEALVRWSDEDGNRIAPDFFVRIAEDKGFIGELTATVLRRATREVGDLLRHNPDFTLSVNIAASDLEGANLLQQLDIHVRQAGIEPRQIALELTERSTADIAGLRTAIQRLHQHGYKIHIDDFGTGFSSLSYLHELSVDAIKIDRSFTQTSGTDAVTASILPQILSMAESWRVEVIVEGVETGAQLDFLESTGKPMRAQGWYFSRPVPAHDLHTLHREARSLKQAVHS